MNVKDMRKVAQFTAKWWTDKVFVKTQDQKITRRDGSDLDGERIEMVVNHCSPLGPDPGKSKAFCARLSELIFDEMVKNNFGEEENWRRYVDLRVDYDPCEILHVVGKEFEIGFGCWPFKTGMTISKDRVEYSNGYCAPLSSISVQTICNDTEDIAK